MTNWYPAFCLVFYLTGVHFRGELQHFGHVGEQNIKCDDDDDDDDDYDDDELEKLLRCQILRRTTY